MTVRTAEELRRALDDALSSDGPTVIDAIIDPEEVAPTLVKRTNTLAVFFAQKTQAEAGAPRPAAPAPLGRDGHEH